MSVYRLKGRRGPDRTLLDIVSQLLNYFSDISVCTEQHSYKITCAFVSAKQTKSYWQLMSTQWLK